MCGRQLSRGTHQAGLTACSGGHTGWVQWEKLRSAGEDTQIDLSTIYDNLTMYKPTCVYQWNRRKIYISRRTKLRHKGISRVEKGLRIQERNQEIKKKKKRKRTGDRGILSHHPLTRPQCPHMATYVAARGGTVELTTYGADHHALGCPGDVNNIP